MEWPLESAAHDGRPEQISRGPGQPPHQPSDVTRGQVEALAGFGVSHEQIGLVIGIDEKTLRKWYRRELDVGKAKANARMAQNIFQKALGDGPQAATLAIFWAKTQMGWREKIEIGTDGRPLVSNSVNVYTSEEDPESMRERLIEKLKAWSQDMKEDDA
jgi:hypothetical protein